MKRLWFAFFILGLCVLSITFLYGCGASPTSGGSSSNGGSSNTGTISGYAYVCNYEGGTYTGTSDVIISVSTEAMSLESTTTTDADGKYTLSGLPSGKVALTATGEGYNPVTIVANSSTVNFVVNSLAQGDTTIRGTIEGIAPGTPVDLYFSSCPPTDADVNCDTSFFDPATMTYEVTDAPGGDSYIAACYDVGGGHYHYAYNRITTSSSGPYDMNISFEAEATIDATLIHVPLGYTPATMGIRVSKNGERAIRVGSADLSGTSCIIDGLPPLKAGDKYEVQINATNEANQYRRYYPNISAGSQPFDDDSSIPSQIMITPASGTFETAPATIEWNSVTGANCYIVRVEGTSFDWAIYTSDTEITIPQCILDIMPAGVKTIFVRANHYNPALQLGNLNEFSTYNFSDWELRGPY